MPSETPKKPRGFAAMSPEKRRAAQSLGGRVCQTNNKAKRWNSLTATQAGKKGGKATSAKPGHMAQIGRVGGLMKAAKRKVGKAFEEGRRLKKFLAKP